MTKNEDIKRIIADAAERTGAPADVMCAIAGPESSYRPDAYNPVGPGAKGLFQFIPGTWQCMVNKYGQQYGIGIGDIFNPEANAMMGGLFIRDNMEFFTRAFGRAPSPGEVYMMHFLGQEGGVKLVTEAYYHPNRSAADVFPAAAAANHNYFYDGNNRPRSASALYAFLDKKIQEQIRGQSIPDDVSLESLEAERKRMAINLFPQEWVIDDPYYLIATPKEADLARRPQEQLWITDKTVAERQEQLKALGYDIGAFRSKDGNPTGIDGRFGPVTEAAVRTFQKERNLQETGKFDAATKQALDAAVEEKQKNPQAQQRSELAGLGAAIAPPPGGQSAMFRAPPASRDTGTPARTS